MLVKIADNSTCDSRAKGFSVYVNYKPGYSMVLGVADTKESAITMAKITLLEIAGKLDELNGVEE